MPTIHVYTNLVQIPVLVLTAGRDRVRTPIAANRFSISLDGKTWAQPTFARLEGEDPIDLAIVLDASTPQADMLPKMDQAIAGLAPTFLHPSDRVSIYVVDCAVVHLVRNVTPDSQQLKKAVDGALSSWTERRESKSKSSCSTEMHLWDVLAYVTGQLSTHSGRRAILAVTNGDDGNSRRSFSDLTGMAQVEGVTIFGLSPSRPGYGTSASMLGQNLLSRVCENTGGLLLTMDGSSLAERMDRFVQMLRERYILEFPRPSHAQAGRLEMSIRIEGMNAFIRQAGDGVPLAAEAEKADPSVMEPEQPAAPARDGQASGTMPASEQHSPVPPETPAQAVP